MTENEIVLFRYRRGLRVGRILEESAGKAKVQVDRVRAFTVPVENVVLATGSVAADFGSLSRFAQAVEETAADLDLGELWELVLGEDEAYTFDDLVDLHGEASTDAEARAALLWHLESEECVHFEPRETKYAPRSVEDVRAAHDRKEKHEARACEEGDFLELLAGRVTLQTDAMSARQLAWVDRLVDFVVRSDESPHAGWCRSFLAAIRRGADLRRFVFDRLTGAGVLDRHEHLGLRRLGVPLVFAEETEAEAEDVASSARELVLGDRRDLRDQEVFTVDSEKTSDIDDALSVETISTGHRVGIHITDLSEAIPAGSAIEREAQQRLTSLYFPERQVPMLPESLSYSVGSLVEGEERPVLSLLVDVDEDGKVLGSELVRAVIRSRARLSYDEADAVIGGGDHALAPAVRALADVAGRLRESRRQAGAVDFERPEVEITVSAEGEVDVECVSRDTPANRLVAEMMVLYNSQVAALCARSGVPALYRVQETSEPPVIDDPSSPHSRYVFFRSVSPARSSFEPGPHRLLGVEPYCQASSPLRRFLDLVLQRQLVHWVREGAPLYDAEQLAEIVSGVAEGARERSSLEPDRRRYWILEWLSHRRRESFGACVLDVRDRDCIVELWDYGLRAPARIGSDVKPGDRVEVRVARIDPWDRDLRLEEASG